MKEIKINPNSSSIKVPHFIYIGGTLFFLLTALFMWYLSMKVDVEAGFEFRISTSFFIGIASFFVLVDVLLTKAVKIQKVIFDTNTITFFHSKNILGKTMEIIITKSEVSQLDLFFKTQLLFTGKIFIPIKIPYLLFSGRKSTEVPLSNWNKTQATEIIREIKNSIPTIEIGSKLASYVNV